MNFKEFMTENNSIYKKLYIFDFDDTLVYTPHPKEGKIIYETKTGEDWKYGGSWWACPESLKPPVVPSPAPISMLSQETAREAYNGIREHNTYVVVMTGRKTRAESEIRRILGDYNIRPDEVICTPFNERVLQFKLNMMKHLAAKFKNLEELHMWDDKGSKHARMYENPDENHVSYFKKMGNIIKETREGQEEELNFKLKINEVLSPKVEAFTEQKKQEKEAEDARNKFLQINGSWAKPKATKKDSKKTAKKDSKKSK